MDTNQQIISAGRAFQNCVAQLEDVLQEPIRAKFAAVREEIGGMIDRLDTTAGANVSDQLANAIARGKKALGEAPAKPAKRVGGLC